MLYSNAQSVINKIEELRAVVSIKRPDVIALTETWTNDDISDDYLNIDGYELMERKDRSDTDRGRGGGILIYVIKGRCAWKEKTGGCFEQHALVRMRGKNGDLGINILYRSPNSSSANDASLCEILRELRGPFVLIGDINYPGIQWESGRADAKSRLFYEEMEDNFFTQHVDKPTHKSGNILDLVISRDENLVESVEYEGRLGKSDHEMLMVTLRMEIEVPSIPANSRDYNRANYVEMRKEMRNVNWEEKLNQSGVEETWCILKRTLDQMVDKWVPWRRKSGRHNVPRWMNNEIRTAVTKKKKAWRKWKESRRDEDKREYNIWETKTKKLIRKRKNALERQIARESKSNPKSFYSHINSARRNRSSIGPLKIDGDLVVNPKDQSNALNDYFSSVFTRCNVESPQMEQPTGIGSIENVAITEESIKNEIGRLKQFSAPGPDDVTNRILIELCTEIAKPLATLFTKSFDEGKIPDDWRLSNVTPVYKQKGSKSEPGNYRPVSLTSNVCKLMEKLVNRALCTHLESGVLNNTQHGFRKGRSCQTNLIEFFDKVTQWTDAGDSVDVLFLDFRKAFDKVDHSRMMVKLAAAGVHGKLWRWIKDWLSGRRQRVVVKGESSEWIVVESGLPQGTVLAGPLFTVYVKDIDWAVIIAFILKFADDTKMAMAIKSFEDARRFQEDIDRLCKWAEDWAMEFNIEKCKIMHIGRNNPRYSYVMNGRVLSVTEEERDLGTWTDCSLKPHLQCTKAANGANRVLGLILKSFHYRTKQSLVPLFKTLVRPKLEFAAASWNPWHEGDIERLRKVQKRLIRSLSNVRGATYEEKLKDAGLTTLKARRERGDLIEAFKTIHGLNNVDKSSWFRFDEQDAARASTRSNTNVENGRNEHRSNVLIRERARTELRNNCFRLRVGRTWNNLPDTVRNVKSTNAFKNAYDSWLQSGIPIRNRADSI